MSAFPQVNIEETIRRTLELVEEEKKTLEYFRSDNAAYQSDVIDLLDDENVGYTITADMDDAVQRSRKLSGDSGGKLGSASGPRRVQDGPPD